MSTELYWMTLTVLMTALLWVPYVVDRYAVRGVWPALIDTKPENDGPQSLWAQRAIRAHENAVENLAIFVPAVLAATALHVSTPVTRTAVVAYFFARLAHVLVYTFGVPVMRTLTFTVGWVAQILVLLSVLAWI
jgi:uncharacterized MAPEG superfamily protein